MRPAVALLLWMGVVAHAAAECRAIEFAELESLRADQLLAMRCEYRRQMHESINAAHAAASRSVPAANAGLAQANRCAQELTRLDRILGRRLALPGSDDAISVHINGLCR